MDKKLKLLKSQKELLRMDRQAINNAMNLVRAKELKFEQDLDNIGVELGIEGDGKKNWKLSNTDDYLEEKIEKKNAE